MRKPPKLKQPRIAPIPPGQICHTPEQVAEALGVAMSTFWLILKSGALKSFKAGRSRRITADAFRDYQDRRAI
ncbi:helix-turn-helix domain-containing protein [Bradyrhizobium sp. 38]|nr:helix-turn-helix domain-containing protein [Bradyrhizobium sp. 38]MCK1775713.1 helix-turn-helix domain-containing protein [Bradyrhizobium sp. 132]